MVSHPPKHDNGLGLATLPFGGLGLDLAEVRRKVRGLLLVPFRVQEAAVRLPRLHVPPATAGYGLLLRLSRETLGS